MERYATYNKETSIIENTFSSIEEANDAKTENEGVAIVHPSMSTGDNALESWMSQVPQSTIDYWTEFYKSSKEDDYDY